MYIAHDERAEQFMELLSKHSVNEEGKLASSISKRDIFLISLGVEFALCLSNKLDPEDGYSGEVECIISDAVERRTALEAQQICTYVTLRVGRCHDTPRV